MSTIVALAPVRDLNARARVTPEQLIERAEAYSREGFYALEAVTLRSAMIAACSEMEDLMLGALPPEGLSRAKALASSILSIEIKLSIMGAA